MFEWICILFWIQLHSSSFLFEKWHVFENLTNWDGWMNLYFVLNYSVLAVGQLLPLLSSHYAWKGLDETGKLFWFHAVCILNVILLIGNSEGQASPHFLHPRPQDRCSDHRVRQIARVEWSHHSHSNRFACCVRHWRPCDEHGGDQRTHPCGEWCRTRQTKWHGDSHAQEDFVQQCLPHLQQQQQLQQHQQLQSGVCKKEEVNLLAVVKLFHFVMRLIQFFSVIHFLLSLLQNKMSNENIFWLHNIRKHDNNCTSHPLYVR